MIQFDNGIKIDAFLNAFKVRKKKGKANCDNSKCIMRWNIGVKQNWTSDKGTGYNGSSNQGSAKPIDRGPNCN